MSTTGTERDAHRGAHQTVLDPPEQAARGAHQGGHPVHRTVDPYVIGDRRAPRRPAAGPPMKAATDESYFQPSAKIGSSIAAGSALPCRYTAAAMAMPT